MSALLRTFFPPWESKVAAMETLDGMPCASLTGAAFKHIYSTNDLPVEASFNKTTSPLCAIGLWDAQRS